MGEVHSFSTWSPRTRLSRRDVEARGQARRLFVATGAVERAARTLGELLSADVGLRVVSARTAPPRPGVDGWLAVALTRAHGGDAAATVEVEPALAVAVTARALRRPAPKVVGPLSREDAGRVAGGLAAVLVTVARGTGHPLSAADAGPAPGVPLGGGLEVDLEVLLDREAYAARVVLAGDVTPPASRFSRSDLVALGNLPLLLPIVAAVQPATAEDLAALEVGDAWMLGDAPWARSLQGDVVLAAPEAQRGLRATLVEQGKLVLRAELEELDGYGMAETETTDPLVKAVGDVPVTVRVEIGSARMTAREWASLGEGDVVTLGHKVGEPVTLRVSGVLVATGELVDVEGEMGVRILRLRGADHAG